MLPLAKDINAPSNKDGRHTGLWYDKFCNQWKDNPNSDNWEGLGEGGKLEWIHTVSQKPCGDADSITEFATRQRDLVSSRNGDFSIFRTDGRFVTGLGRTHPVENGFAWHPTLGTPYMPGSSVKGLVRAWVESGWAEETISPEVFHRIFGSEFRKGSPHRSLNGDHSNRGGSILFLDAIPIRPTKLEADVMTPHYGPYYSQGEAPGDWHNPTPIPFLAVAHDQPFQFAIMPASNSQEGDLKTVAGWLEAALAVIGAGAKTAVGYGRFHRHEETEDKLRKEDENRSQKRDKAAKLEKALSGKSELCQDLMKEAASSNWESDKEAFVKDGLIESWLDRLENDPDPEAISFLRGLIVLHLSEELLANPDKMGGKKMNRPAFKPRQIKVAKRLNKLLSN